MTNSNFISPVKWIKISLFAECTNYTIDAIKAKRIRCIWKDGVITKRAPDGCVLINIEAYNKWAKWSLKVSSFCYYLLTMKKLQSISK